MSAIDHHDDHADEPWLQHHWNNSGQQFEAGKLGMWLFLATEFLLFAGLFCAYTLPLHWICAGCRSPRFQPAATRLLLLLLLLPLPCDEG